MSSQWVGNPLQLYLGLIVMTIQVDGQELQDTGVLVVRKTPEATEKLEKMPGVIGLNVLSRLQGYGNMTMSAQLREVVAEKKQRSGFVRVASCSEVLVPHRSSKVVPVRAPTGWSGQGLIEPLLNVPTILQPAFVVTPHKWTITAINPSDRDITLKPNTKVGFLSTVETICLRESQVDIKQGGDEIVLTIPQEEAEPPEVDVAHFRGTVEEVDSVKALLKRNADVFIKKGEPLSCTSTVEHQIKLEDSVAVQQPYRRIPPQLWREVEEHLKDLEKKGIIRESSSDFSSPIVVVRKKDGQLQVCMDYPKLNSKIRCNVSLYLE